MKKFIIQSTKIENSDVPEKIGISCQLKDKFNIVCSDNASGKSSTLKFIREGFFKKSKQDKGQIYFSVDSKNYVQLVNNTKSVSRKTVDINGNISDEVLSPNVFTSEARFNDAFTLNLDDIKNDSAEFFSAIKDPSGGKVQVIKSGWEKSIEDFVGSGNTPKKAMGYKELNELLQDLSDFRDKEGFYQKVVNESNAIGAEVDILKAEQKNLAKIIEVKKRKIETEENKKAFNEALYINREKAPQYCEKVSEFVRNTSELDSKNEELNNILQKTEQIKTSLKSKFYLDDMTEEFVLNFRADEQTLDEIQSDSQELIRLVSELKNLKNNKEQSTEHKNKLENEKKNIMFPEQIDTEILEGISLNLSELLGEYQNSADKLAELQIHNKESKGQKINLILFILFALCAVGGACFSKNMVVIISIAVSVLILAVVFFKSLSFKKNIPVETQMQKRAELLSLLKSEILKYDNNIRINDDSDIKIKAQMVINHISEQIMLYKNDINSCKTKINEKEHAIEDIKNDIALIENKIKQLEENIKLLQENVNNKISDVFGNFKVNPDSCREVSRNITELKANIQKTKQIQDRISNLKETNINIFDEIRNFIKECKLDSEIVLMSHSDLTQKIRDDLASRNKINNEYKIALDKANEQLSIYLSMIPGPVQDNIDKDEEELSAKIKEIENTLEIKEKELTEKKAEIKKLEEVGYFEAKEVNYKIKLKAYENKVREIFAQRMAIMLIDKAAENFYKSRPALKKAEEFLSILSDNKYTKLNLDAKTVGTESDSFKKDWAELSLGEKDMVYIALRLGYVANYSYDSQNNTETGKYSIPFIVDEVFVNLDDKRMVNLLKCLDKMSETNQVIFFTCHKTEITELIKQSGLEGKVNLTEIYKV